MYPLFTVSELLSPILCHPFTLHPFYSLFGCRRFDSARHSCFHAGPDKIHSERCPDESVLFTEDREYSRLPSVGASGEFAPLHEPNRGSIPSLVSGFCHPQRRQEPCNRPTPRGIRASLGHATFLRQATY